MNKKFINIGIMTLIALQISCDDYLKDDSGDLLIPKTVEQYTPLLYGEAYPQTFDEDIKWQMLMTDDIEMGYLERDPSVDDSDEADVLNMGEGKQAYIWHYNIEDKLVDNNWDKRYANILGCNTIIDALPEMEYPENEKGKFNYLAAQAYALRAYHYFCLVNSYALPWSEENLDKLGVIIRTTPQIQTEFRERSTIREVYTLINDDITKAMEYAESCEPSVNKRLLSPAAIKLLATRIALFQEKWEEVISIGSTFLRENNFILDLNTIPEDKLGSDLAENSTGDKTIYYFTMFNVADNREILFTFGGKNSYSYFSNSVLWGFGFRVSHSSEGSLLKCYGDDDIRLLAFFQKDKIDPGLPPYIPESMDYKYHYPIKYKTGKSVECGRENWRTVEVLLNVAEAYARQSAQISQDAIDLINRLRERRIKTETYVPKQVSDFANKEDLVKFIWAERRRELCFEESMRFWDLRRQGMPEIQHRYYYSKTNYETYTLEQGSPNYVLAIPASEMNNNPKITSNERVDIMPR